MDQMDYFENEIRQIIIMMKDARFDGYMQKGLRDKLRRIRDLIDKELKE